MDRSGIEITLEPATQVEGRIVDREHKPLLGWIVAVREPAIGADGELYYANITVTGDDGRFRLGKLHPSAWALVAIPGSQRLLPRRGPFTFEDPVWRTPAQQIITPHAGETLDLGDLVVDPTG